MNERKLSDTVVQRLDAAIDRDPACMAAMDAWYEFKNQFDGGGALAHLDVHEELDGLTVDYMEAVKRAAWLDGWQCGRNPEFLVFQTGGEVQR